MHCFVSGMSDTSEDELWEDDEGQTEDDELAVICLFCTKSCPKAEILFDHMSTDHQFDMLVAISTFKLTAIDYIRLVNFVRTQKSSPQLMYEILTKGSPYAFQKDEFMNPAFQDDPLLWFDVEDVETVDASDINSLSKEELMRHTEGLKDQLEDALEQIASMRRAAQHLVDSGPIVPCAAAGDFEDGSGAYFSSYGHYGIHEEMLKDTVRTLSFKQWIEENKDCFNGKVVLDVGCGTAILSMFAAKAGAQKVFAIDNSDILYQAIDIVQENGLDNIISLKHCRVESCTLPVGTIDVIISEWMGYFLLFESMLDSVIFARDKWKAKLVLPNIHRMVIVGITDPKLHADKLSYWNDVYGFKMSCMKTTILQEAIIHQVDASSVATDAATVSEIDLNTIVSASDAYFRERSFVLRPTTSCDLHAFVGYFESTFLGGRSVAPVALSTGPLDAGTHWKQTVFLLREPLAVEAGDTLNCTISCTKLKTDTRCLNVVIAVKTSTGELGHNYVVQ